MQDSSLAGLPADVLQSLCRVVQLDAVTSHRTRYYTELMRERLPDIFARTPKPAFLGLRLCSKELRSANDSVRTSVKFCDHEMNVVKPYLRKLPSLSTVAVDCEEGDGDLNRCLRALHSIAPKLESLALRYVACCGPSLGQEQYCHHLLSRTLNSWSMLVW